MPTQGLLNALIKETYGDFGGKAAFCVTQTGSSGVHFGDLCTVAYAGGPCIAIDGGQTDEDMPFLRRSPLSDIIVSHWHRDHIYYLEKYGVPNRLIHGLANTVEGQQKCQAAKDNRRARQFINVGNDYAAADYFRVFAPPPIADKDENSCSLASMISTGVFRFFSLGDTTPTAFTRKNFKEYYETMGGTRLPIIKLPHHGSKSNNLLNKEFMPFLSKTGVFIVSGWGADYCHETILQIIMTNTRSIVVLLTRNGASKREILGSDVFKKLIIGPSRGRFCVADSVEFNVDSDGRFIAAITNVQIK